MPSILSRVLKPARALRRWLTRTVIEPELTRQFWASPFFRAFTGGRIEDAYETHAWVFASLSSWCRNIAGLPFLIRRGTRAESSIIETGPWNALFENPNPAMTPDQFWWSTIINLGTSRRGCMIVKVGRADGPIAPDEIPMELWPTSGSLYDPITDENDPTRLLYWQLISARKGQRERLFPHEVIQLKFTHPKDIWSSMPPLKAAGAAVTRDGKGDAYDNAFFDNAAIPGGIITMPEGSTKEQREEIRQELSDKHGGAGKSFKALVLEGGMIFTPASETRRDMQYIEMRGWDRDEVLAVHGVPKTEVGLDAGANMITGQGLLSSDRGYWSRILDPLARMIEQTFRARLFTPVDRTIFGEFDRTVVSALKQNFSDSIEQGKGLMELGYTLNQINDRLALGMEEVSWGDTAYVSLLLSPISEEDDESGNQPAEEHAPQTRDADEPEIMLSDDNRTALATYWRKAQETILPMEASFRGVWGKHLMGLRAETLARVRAGQDPFDRTRADASVREATAVVLNKVTGRAASDIGKAIDKDTTLSDSERIGIVGAVQRDLVRSNVTLERRLDKTLAEGKTNGESIEQLEGRVRQVFNTAKSRASQTAMETINSVVNRTRISAMRKGGIKHHAWATQQDAKVRVTHIRVNSQVRKLGKQFSNGLEFPRDPRGRASEVYGCRCLTVPAIVGDDGSVLLLFGEKKTAA